MWGTVAVGGTYDFGSNLSGASINLLRGYEH